MQLRIDTLEAQLAALTASSKSPSPNMDVDRPSRSPLDLAIDPSRAQVPADRPGTSRPAVSGPTSQSFAEGSAPQVNPSPDQADTFQGGLAVNAHGELRFYVRLSLLFHACSSSGQYEALTMGPLLAGSDLVLPRRPRRFDLAARHARDGRRDPRLLSHPCSDPDGVACRPGAASTTARARARLQGQAPQARLRVLLLALCVLPSSRLALELALETAADELYHPRAQTTSCPSGSSSPTGSATRPSPLARSLSLRRTQTLTPPRAPSFAASNARRRTRPSSSTSFSRRAVATSTRTTTSRPRSAAS
mgnify:CR=1 FL=1